MAGQGTAMPTLARRPAAHQERERLQARRLGAAELFAIGVRQAEVARQLGVSPQTVSVWHARWRAGGLDGLRSRGPTGPAPKVSDTQLAEVEDALLEGATANGFTGELWTLDRIATVIERLTGVRHHPAHVWALLHHRLGWSVQRPTRRAAERDQADIDRWVKERWPKIKADAQRRRACLVFFDESALSLTPNVRRTWAPRGQSPTLTHPFNWKKASMAAALCYGVRGGGAQLCFHVHPGNYHTEVLIGVLGQLRTFLGGEKATLLWDGLPAHRSTAMRVWLHTQRSWLVAERLPAYAPDLNPVEGLWSSLKAVELANLTSPTLAEVIEQAHRGVERVRQTPHVAYSFLRHTGLSVA
jgi:transposase